MSGCEEIYALISSFIFAEGALVYRAPDGAAGMANCARHPGLLSPEPPGCHRAWDTTLGQGMEGGPALGPSQTFPSVLLLVLPQSIPQQTLHLLP